MHPQYDDALPITAHRAEILEALSRHPVLVVCGATGSGKSTQLPKLCLEAGRGVSGLIGHTQPRRIAARALASRIATELGTSLAVPGKRAGDAGIVGYKVRFNDRTGPNTRIKLMTDGILLKELETDRALRRYDTLIIDEAHERSLNIDLLLGVLRQLQPQRPELRIIVTSATIDPGRFAAFFNGAPVIEVSGRSYPVEVRYRPLDPEVEEGTGLTLPQAVVAAIRELDELPVTRADTLVFLPGEKDIRLVAAELMKAQLANTEVLPLFARLSSREQQRIFQPHTRRRIVLATNVAETSLTVPGIRCVVDSGLARLSRYSPRAKVQRLPIEPISQASAEQRKGRCGREAPGVCIRLYPEADLLEREPFTPPEVLRTNLASVILRMAVLGLGAPDEFPFLDPPDTRLVNDGVRLLQELKAMDADGRVTSLGARIATLPVDPRLGRMLLAAAHHHCVAEMLVLAAFLEAQDPRERPVDAQPQAAEKHALFADARSDFVTVLNLWRAWRQHQQKLSGAKLRQWCREHFLSFIRLREWQDLHEQLAQAVRALQLHPNQVEASYTDLHQAILTGFLGSIGHLDERREYDGPRGTRFVIAPGTPLAARPPKWIVAGSLIETARLYARSVAAVHPAWIEAVGAHLIKRMYSEPHWVAGRGFVAAFETVTLHGLTLVTRRRISYGTIAPTEARELFIRAALLAPSSGIRARFLDANRKLQAEIELLEAKIRRRDVLVQEDAQLAFYAQRIPERVSSVSAFEQWRIRAERQSPELLFMQRADLMRRAVPEASVERFPDELHAADNQLPLRYRFEPSAADDGLTLIVPEVLLDRLDADRLAWLVPGLQLEKVIAILRALPKALRKQLVPVPQHAQQALAEMDRLHGFHAELSAWITRRTGESIAASELAALPLPAHLRLNIRVMDARDRTLAEGRNLAILRRRLGAHREAYSAHATAAASEALSVHRSWDFGPLPECAEVKRNGLRLRVYPALEDRASGVVLTEARSVPEAAALTRRALVRLAMITLSQQARHLSKRLADERELVLLSGGLPLSRPVSEALTYRAFAECFVPDDESVPRSAADFAARLEARRAQLDEMAERLAKQLTGVLREWRAIRSALQKLPAGAFSAAVADINTQLHILLPGDFIEATPRPWFDYLPRYLRAIVRRIERLSGNAGRDSELAAKVKPFVAGLLALQTQPRHAAGTPERTQLRWMIEEYRVSLFAQDLKAMLRVSDKRLAQQLAAARSEAGG